MAGAGSCLDRNDHRLIERLTRQIERVADELEELNESTGGGPPAAEMTWREYNDRVKEIAGNDDLSGEERRERILDLRDEVSQG